MPQLGTAWSDSAKLPRLKAQLEQVLKQNDTELLSQDDLQLGLQLLRSSQAERWVADWHALPTIARSC
jgi:hypothetical protein